MSAWTLHMYLYLYESYLAIVNVADGHSFFVSEVYRKIQQGSELALRSPRQNSFQSEE